MTTTWKEQIQIEMEEREELGSGMTAILEGCPFTVWTTNRVYFPAHKHYQRTKNDNATQNTN